MHKKLIHIICNNCGTKSIIKLDKKTVKYKCKNCKKSGKIQQGLIHNKKFTRIFTKPELLILYKKYHIRKKSLIILSDQPFIWKHLFMAQVIVDEFKYVINHYSVKSKSPNHKIKKIYSIQEFCDWFYKQLDYINYIERMMIKYFEKIPEIHISLNEKELVFQNFMEIVIKLKKVKDILKYIYCWQKNIRNIDKSNINKSCIDIIESIILVGDEFIDNIKKTTFETLKFYQYISKNKMPSKKQKKIKYTINLKTTGEALQEVNDKFDIFRYEIYDHKYYNDSNSNKGYLYILTNQSMEGLLKIGKTKNDPNKRAKQLSTTGVPQPFNVQYYALFDDMDEAEKIVHQELSKYNAGKEFFHIDILHAIEIIENINVRFIRVFSKSDITENSWEIDKNL